MKPQLDKLQPYLFATLLAATPSFGQTSVPLKLDWLLNQALKNNPGLQSASSQAEVSHYRAQAEPSIPAPMIGVGSMGADNPLKAKGRMELSFEVSQSIPFPSKISARSRAAGSEARSSAEKLKSQTLTLKSQAKVAFFEAFGASAKQKLLKEMSRIYRDHLKRLRAGAFSTPIMQAHVLTAQSELDLIDNEIESAHEQQIAAQSAINTLLGRPANDSLGDPEETSLSKLPSAPTTQQSEMLQNTHPRIQAIDANVSTLQAKHDLATKAWLPDFTMTYRYNRRYDQIMTNSELMLGMSLPFVFPWQPRSEARAAAAEWQSAQAELRQMRNEFQSELIKSHAALTASYARLMMLQNKVLPKAQERMKIMHNLSPTDMETLNEHLDAMKFYIEVNTKALEERVAFEKALAVYEELSPQNGESSQGSIQ